MNLTNGPGSRMVKGKGRSTPISLKSVPTLLSRSEETYPPKPPNLLLQLSHPKDKQSASNVKLTISSSDYPEETLKKTKMSYLSLRGERKKKICPGIKSPIPPPVEAAVSRPVKHLSNLEKTYQESSLSCELPVTYQKESPPLNGTESSEESPLISTRSSPPCTMSRLMRRERDAWETLRSFLLSRRPSSRSKLGQSGQWLSEDSSK